MRVLRGFLKPMLRKPFVFAWFPNGFQARILHGFLKLLLRKPCVLRGFLTCLGNLVFYVVSGCLGNFVFYVLSGKHVFYMVS